MLQAGDERRRAKAEAEANAAKEAELKASAIGEGVEQEEAVEKHEEGEWGRDEL